MTSSRDGRRNPERREQILEAAQALFLTHGLNGVTTRQIAQLVGISQPSLYAHFATREAIALALSERAFHRLSARLEAVSNALVGQARVLALCSAYISFGLEQPAAYKIAFMSELIAPDSEAGKQALGAGLEGFMVLRRACGDLRPDPAAADLLAQSIWASIHGLVALLLARPEFPFAPWGTLIDAHLENVAAAIGRG